jgi:DNA-binding XRE family transcriptional regulator
MYLRKRQIKPQNQSLTFANKESNVMKQMLKNWKNKMDKRKKKDLESKGYKVGTVGEFLGLSTEESEYIELKLALSDALAKRRKKSNLTQTQLAKLLKSSQSRIAKMEKGDPTVSVDLLVKSLLAMGANKKSIAKAIS